MRHSLLSITVLSVLIVPTFSYAEVAVEPASPHSVTYNVGLYSQYIFRGLTQTNQDPALQGGVDYGHSNGFYLGSWASNISSLSDSDAYKSSSLELDIYAGFAKTLGDTGISYNLGVLQYIYPGSKNAGVKSTETTEVYGSLSYDWLAAKLSVVASDGAFGIKNADGSWYAELNANYPVGKTGFTINGHVGRQEFKGAGNDAGDYTDWKLGATKSWSNAVNVGAYYTTTNARDSTYTLLGDNIGDDQFTVFVQKTF